MQKYLKPTYYMDYETPEVQQVLGQFELEGLPDKEKVRKLFYHVRDSITYSAKINSLDPKIFKSSFTLHQDSSFCIPKALAFSALVRAIGIPSRIHLVDFYNHRLSEKLENIWGTKVMAGHCYSEVYLDGKWIKVTPALDLTTCETYDFIPIEFNGKDDGLLKPVDKKGNPHAEYIKDHGTFDDLPYELVMKIFDETYGPLNDDKMEKLFGMKGSEFEKINV